MLFSDRKNSALVRLSDSIKDGLGVAEGMTDDVLELYSQHEEPFGRAREIASHFAAGRLDAAAAEAEIARITASIPPRVALQGAYLQRQLHSQALSTTLMCCFCLESYINSLAYFLLEVSDLLGLVAGERRSTAEVLIEAIDRMTVADKWQAVSRLGGGEFDRSRPPFQDLIILFRFRDDHVHDKVIAMDEERSRKRYNRKLPDPVFGFLDLGHALFGAVTYWDMVVEVHRLTGAPMKDFQRHYNLSPWRDDTERRRMIGVANRYTRVLRPSA